MRKQPHQQRARLLVQSLVDAAGQIVAAEGLDALTTVRVAERAGVSVGSLYQYFRHKEELIEALIDRVDQDMVAAVDSVLARAVDAKPEAFARLLLDAAFTVFEARDGLAQEVLRHWHRLDIANGLYRFEQRMMEVLRAYALEHLADHPVDPSPARAFIAINSVTFTLLRYLSLESQPAFSREELLDELSMMAARLIEQDRAIARKRKRR